MGSYTDEIVSMTKQINQLIDDNGLQHDNLIYNGDFVPFHSGYNYSFSVQDKFDCSIDLVKPPRRAVFFAWLIGLKFEYINWKWFFGMGEKK